MFLNGAGRTGEGVAFKANGYFFFRHGQLTTKNKETSLVENETKIFFLGVFFFGICV